MNHFIVMQGHTYQEEKTRNYLVTQKDKGGNVPHSWKRMMEVKREIKSFIM